MSNYASWAWGIFWACVEYDTDLSDAIHEAADCAEDVIYTARAFAIYSEHGEHDDLEMGDCASIDNALTRNAYFHVRDSLLAEMPCVPDSPREMIDARINECLDDIEGGGEGLYKYTEMSGGDWEYIVSDLNATGSDGVRVVMSRWIALVAERAE